MTRVLVGYDGSDAARAAIAAVLGSVISGLVHAGALPVLVVPDTSAVAE